MPTISIGSKSDRLTGIRVANRASRKPVSSSTLTPRIWNTVSRAAICESLYLPLVILSNKFFASSRFSSSWLKRRDNIAFISFELLFYAFRKLAIIVFPFGVSTDSGWNWIPCTSYFLCLSAMIYPSRLIAVTSKQSGNSSVSTTHE